MMLQLVLLYPAPSSHAWPAASRILFSIFGLGLNKSVEGRLNQNVPKDDFHLYFCGFEKPEKHRGKLKALVFRLLLFKALVLRLRAGAIA